MSTYVFCEANKLDKTPVHFIKKTMLLLTVWPNFVCRFSVVLFNSNGSSTNRFDSSKLLRANSGISRRAGLPFMPLFVRICSPICFRMTSSAPVDYEMFSTDLLVSSKRAIDSSKQAKDLLKYYFIYKT